MFLPGVVGSLWCRPLDREPRSHPRLVLVLLDQPGQPEVCDLDVVVVPDQTVPADIIYFILESEVISRLWFWHPWHSLTDIEIILDPSHSASQTA